MELLNLFSILLILISLPVYYLVSGNQRLVLLAASLLFFFIFSPVGCLILLLEAFLVFRLAKAGKGEERKERRRRRALYFWIFFFYLGLKYLVPKTGSSLLATSDILSISFSLGSAYFFLRFISYVSDLKSGRILHEESFTAFLLYLIYFPAIVQGPIERYENFSEKTSRRICFSHENLNAAAVLILYGLFKIFCISRLSSYYSSNIMSGEEGMASPFYYLFCLALYSLQLYADFSGGIDLVRGVSFLYGIDLAENFRTPYFSTSFSEFWKRWHITFSSWLKDYVYIPLGGSRAGKRRKAYNLFLVFLVSGLWHGISIPFLLWGILQAIYVVSESERKVRRHPGWNRVKVFLAMSFSWIFFRATDLRGLADALRNLWQTILKTPQYFRDHVLFLRQFFAGSAELLDGPLGLYCYGESFGFFLVVLAVLTFFAFLEFRFYKTETDIVSLIAKRPHCSRILFAVLLVLLLLLGVWGESYSSADFIYGAF